ncbi:MAG: hypothetical protein OSJ83_06695 [Clostridia bacterium]|nr:hypothetical protein [Clostridia bacterium]
MFKRIVIGILSVVIAACMLTGCTFFSHDTERDMQQEIARVKSYEITNSVRDDDDNVKEAKYTTPEKVIYKRDLIEYVNNNASNLSQSFGSDLEGLYKYAARMLVSVELVTNEVNALIDCGTIEWGWTETNAVKRNIYAVIDNTLTTLKNNILEERDEEPGSSSSDETVDSDTTYPVKPEESGDDDDMEEIDKKDTEEWFPEVSKFPGNSGDENTRSLEREAMRRFIALIESSVKDDFRITADERAAFDKEIEAINEKIDNDGIGSVYEVIGTYPVTDKSPFGHIMYYISGKSYERSQKISSLQRYLTDGVKVEYADVQKSYDSQLNAQKAQYTQDIAAYDKAMSDGSTTVLYNANSNYFYVKHILLPFSDAQKSELEAFKNRKDIASLEENEKDKLVKAKRDQLSKAIIAYPHVNGEDDKSRPMSVSDIMAHIRSVMLEKAPSVQSADAAFDDLIYLYNTDPGAFGNSKGYVVKEKLNAGENETYMQEFADAARYMRRNLQPGEVYYTPVVTDFGVHIMYLASVVKQGEVGLNDYTTAARTETYYDLLETPLRTSLENAAYTKWENNVLTYNLEKQTEIYEKTFSDLWEA